MTPLFALLGLAAIFYSVFSKEGRERARQLPSAEKKKRLYISCAGMSAFTLLVSYHILESHLHHAPIRNVLWIALIFGIAVAAWTGRGIMRFADNGKA